MTRIYRRHPGRITNPTVTARRAVDTVNLHVDVGAGEHSFTLTVEEARRLRDDLDAVLD